MARRTQRAFGRAPGFVQKIVARAHGCLHGVCSLIKALEDRKVPDPDADSQQVQVTGARLAADHAVAARSMLCRAGARAVQPGVHSPPAPPCSLAPPSSQAFLSNMEAAFRQHPVWAGTTPDVLNQAVEVGAVRLAGGRVAQPGGSYCWRSIGSIRDVHVGRWRVHSQRNRHASGYCSAYQLWVSQLPVV